MSWSAKHSTAGRLAVLVLLSLWLGAPSLCAGQVRVALRAGIVTTSNLVRDSIVEPIEVRPNSAAYVGLALDTPLRPGTRLGGSVEVGRSDLLSRTPTGESAVSTLTVWHPAATLSQQLSTWVAVELEAGLIVYNPSRRLGTIFQSGTPVEPALGITLSLTRSIGARFAAALEAGYDVHRFSTEALRQSRFTGETTVHRFSIGVSVRAHNGPANQ